MNKKRSTLRKQFSRSIMGVIAAVFLTIGLLTVILTFDVVTSLVTQGTTLFAESVVAMMSKMDFSDKDLGDIVESNEFHEVNKQITKYKDEIQMLVHDITIIAKKDNGYVYLMGFNEDKTIAPLTEYTENDPGLIKTISTGQNTIDELTPMQVLARQHFNLYIPIIENDEVIGAAHMEVKANIIFWFFMAIIGAMIGIIVVLILLVGIMVSRVAKRQTHTIEKLVAKMKLLSKLEGDLTQRIQIQSNNEIGELAEYTNTLLDTIQNFMIQTREHARDLSEASNTFTAVVEETAATAEVINSNIDEMSEHVVKQQTITKEVRSHVRSINDSVNQVANNAIEVAAEAVKADTNVNEGMSMLREMSDYVEEAVQKVEETGVNVKELDNLSQQINLIVDAITGIATQTNMLALNASIEAARAGEHGKGFAVVAEEVRKLAEESATQAEDITILISQVQAGIDKASSSMEVARGTMVKEKSMVEDVSERFNEIAESMQAVSHKVEEVSSQAQEMASGSSIVAEEIDNLSAVTKESGKVSHTVADSMKEQNDSVEQLAHDIERVDNIAVDLVKRMDGLILE